MLFRSMMAKSLGKIEWDVWAVSFSAFITIIFMILTYSISNGIGFGFIAYIVAMIFSKKAKEVHWMMYVVGGAFVVYYVLTTIFL